MTAAETSSSPPPEAGAAASDDTVEIEAEPSPRQFDRRNTALLVIDMQRDFLERGGFGEALGNDVTRLQRAVGPCSAVIAAARRQADMLVIHTRESHRPDLSDVHPAKQQSAKGCIGRPGPLGRILVRGEPGCDIIPALAPISGEPVIDKCGKSSFYGTDLATILVAREIRTLIVCGVTTEVCVHSTVREATDRGYTCIVVSDACASYHDEFHDVALRMITAQGGIFGSVTDSRTLIAALSTSSPA